MKNYFKEINYKAMFLLAVIILTMFNNLDHMMHVYYEITALFYTGEELLKANQFAYLVAVSFDITVIAFIINGRTFESIVFALGLFIINIIFWDVYNEARILNYNNPADYHKVSLLVAKFIFSAGFSFLIHRASTLYFEIKNGFSSIEHAAAEIKQLKAENEHVKAESEHWKDRAEQEKRAYDKAFERMNIVIAENEHIKAEITCKCGFLAPIDKGLNSALKSISAHKGVCKKSNN